MTKLIALYRKPDDAAAFDEHFLTVHLPLVRKIPGIRNIEITRITGTPMGDTRYHLLAELTFDSMDAMNAANATPEGKAVALDLMSFGAQYVTLFFGEVKE